MTGAGVKVTLLCVPGRDERGYNLWHNASLRGYYALQNKRNNHLAYLTRPSAQAEDWDGARTRGEPFGADGRFLSQAEILRMRDRAGGGRLPTVWYGTVSLYGDDAPAMTTDAWRRLVGSVVPGFLSRVGMVPGNVDTICVAHTADRWDGHVHVLFWEKERMHDAGGRLTYTPARDVWGNAGVLKGMVEEYVSDGRNFSSCTHTDMLLSLSAAARGVPGLCGKRDTERALDRLAEENAGRKRKDVVVTDEDRRELAAAMYLADGRVRETEDRFASACEAAGLRARRAGDRTGEYEARRMRGLVDGQMDGFLRDTAFRLACVFPAARPRDAEGEEIATNGDFVGYWKCSREREDERRKILEEFPGRYSEKLREAAENAAQDMLAMEEASRERVSGYDAFAGAGRRAGKERRAPREEARGGEERSR